MISQKEAEMQNNDRPKFPYYQPQQGEIDFYNQQRSKNYAAGIIASCICQDNQQAYILLGEESNGWCYFQGWQDKGDINQLCTAAREGAEESNDIIGDYTTLVEVLHDPNSNEQIFQGCFHIFLGVLTTKKMQELVDKFQERRSKTNEKARKEHKQLQFITLKGFQQALDQNQCEEFNHKTKKSLRKFIIECFPPSKYWNQFSSLKLLNQNKVPFPNYDINWFMRYDSHNWVQKYEF